MSDSNSNCRTANTIFIVICAIAFLCVVVALVICVTSKNNEPFVPTQPTVFQEKFNVDPTLVVADQTIVSVIQDVAKPLDNLELNIVSTAKNFNIPDNQRQPPIKTIISLTTIFSRLEVVRTTIKSLVEQTMGVKIYIYISPDPYMLDKGISIMNTSIIRLKSEFEGFIEFRYCKNYGPYRKLIPAYLEQINCGPDGCIIITVDDDTYYVPNFVETLVDTYMRERCVVCCRARSINFRQIIKSLKDDESTSISMFRMGEAGTKNMDYMPEGVGGILYNTNFLSPDILEFVNVKNVKIYTNDDVWFRLHTFKKEIPVYLVNLNYQITEVRDGLYQNFNDRSSLLKLISDILNYENQKMFSTCICKVGFERKDLIFDYFLNKFNGNSIDVLQFGADCGNETKSVLEILIGHKKPFTIDIYENFSTNNEYYFDNFMYFNFFSNISKYLTNNNNIIMHSYFSEPTYQISEMQSANMSYNLIISDVYISNMNKVLRKDGVIILLSQKQEFSPTDLYIEYRENEYYVLKFK
jgi:hypothetical protein